jgi:hypothetical protein
MLDRQAEEDNPTSVDPPQGSLTDSRNLPDPRNGRDSRNLPDPNRRQLCQTFRHPQHLAKEQRI